ncbi:MAG: ABC transporter ATP-binding protein [Bdellovibrionales bacterium]|nr:ABC transporter ATP-binding protein [Bdellovibrionales bacterium]
MIEGFVDIRDLEVRLGGTVLLEGVTCAVPQGAFLSILGPNGAGKTTLIRAMAGLNRYQGSIRYGGTELATLHPRERARRVCYVPQQSNGAVPFRVYELLQMARYAHGGTWRGGERIPPQEIRDTLSLCQAGELEQRLFCELSGGEQQKVSLAAALVQGGDVLLLDEPGTFLDPRMEDELFAILCELRDSRAVTIFIVTHDINRALLSSSHVLLLKGGRALFSGPVGTIADGEALKELFDTDFLFVPHPETGIAMAVPRRRNG